MNGVLNLNKPAGYTSFDCVAILRRLTGERKIGHTGTLDPQATGVLPVCIGKATRLLEFMDSAPKTYVCGCTLGLETDTQDIWGSVKSDRRAEIASLTRENVEKVLDTFRGEIEQKPPVFSAIKVGGKRLYEYAREGRDVEVPVRLVTIHGIRMLDWQGPQQPFTFEVVCSRGTYVRAICHDMGQTLGCGACMSSLVRTNTCGYSLEQALSLEDLRSMNAEQIEALLDPPETAVSHLPRLELDEEHAKLFTNGNPIWSDGLTLFDEVQAVFHNSKLIGIVRDRKIAKVL
ncbi:MAG: tRNA pseudouridine(55) synthase TruB [Firmicutes bacterium]|nr:tRNA pseudouridine(55) synthase TruB [Bacillota bacterium]